MLTFQMPMFGWKTFWFLAIGGGPAHTLLRRVNPRTGTRLYTTILVFLIGGWRHGAFGLGCFRCTGRGRRAGVVSLGVFALVSPPDARVPTMFAIGA